MSEWHKRECICYECDYAWDGMVLDGCRVVECPQCRKMSGIVGIEQTGEWDQRYRRLEKGEIVMAGDEVDLCNDGWRDNPLWFPADKSIGTPAPDPIYPSHRIFRRLIDPRPVNTDSTTKEKGEK